MLEPFSFSLNILCLDNEPVCARLTKVHDIRSYREIMIIITIIAYTYFGAVARNMRGFIRHFSINSRVI